MGRQRRAMAAPQHPHRPVMRASLALMALMTLVGCSTGTRVLALNGSDGLDIVVRVRAGNDTVYRFLESGQLAFVYLGSASAGNVAVSVLEYPGCEELARFEWMPNSYVTLRIDASNRSELFSELERDTDGLTLAPPADVCA